MADHLLIPLPGRKAPMWKNNQQLIYFFLLAYRTLTKQGVEKEIKGIKDVLVQNKMHRDPHSPPHPTPQCVRKAHLFQSKKHRDPDLLPHTYPTVCDKGTPCPQTLLCSYFIPF